MLWDGYFKEWATGISGSTGGCWRSTEAEGSVLLCSHHTSPIYRPRTSTTSCLKGKRPSLLLLESILPSPSALLISPASEKGHGNPECLSSGIGDIRCWIILCAGTVLCRTCGSIPGLHPLGARSIHFSVLAIKTVSRHCHLSPPLLAKTVKQVE